MFNIPKKKFMITNESLFETELHLCIAEIGLWSMKTFLRFNRNKSI